MVLEKFCPAIFALDYASHSLVVKWKKKTHQAVTDKPLFYVLEIYDRDRSRLKRRIAVHCRGCTIREPHRNAVNSIDLTLNLASI